VSEAAKQRPGQLNFSSPGPGTLSFLVGEEINRRSGLNAVHLAFKGGAPAVQALLADQVQYCAITLNLLGPHFASGKLNPLAVTSAARSAQLPNAPTVAEPAFPAFEAQKCIVRSPPPPRPPP